MPIPTTVPLSRILRAVLLLIGTSVGVNACARMATPAAPAPAAVPKTLFQRLGGLEAVAAVTDDFLGRVLADPKLKPYFKGLEERDLQRIRQHVVDQLCNATGGPCFYPGKDMKTTHQEMEINADIYNAFTGHLGETLEKFKVPDRERNELATIINSLRGQIVNR
jgi:hemoglobin